MDEFLTILIVVVVIALIVYLIKKNKKSHAAATAETAAAASTNPAIDGTNTQPRPPMTINEASSESQSLADYNASTQENFTSVVTKDSMIDEQGNIEGRALFTDGYSDRKFDDYVKAVQGNVALGEGEGCIGGTKGDYFGNAYDNAVEIMKLEGTGDAVVRSERDQKQISDLMGEEHNRDSCIISRGGASRGKLYLAPLDTELVLDKDVTPERERSRDVRAVGTLIHAQAFDVDPNRLVQMDGKGWAKGFAPKSTGKIGMEGIQQPTTSVAETFTKF